MKRELIVAIVFDNKGNFIETLFAMKNENDRYILNKDGSVHFTNKAINFLHDYDFRVPHCKDRTFNSILFIDDEFGIYNSNMDCFKKARTFKELDIENYENFS